MAKTVKTKKVKKYKAINKKTRLTIAKESEPDVYYITEKKERVKSSDSKEFSDLLLKFIKHTHDDLDESEERSLEYLLPFKWDAPFEDKPNQKFRFIDLFAGIGGFHLAFQNLGGECVFASEYNKYAQITYAANFGVVPFGDITKINEKEIPDHEILLAGFPCQPFSLAGVSKKNALGRAHGFLDETQGTLFFDLARIIEEKRPKAFMLENVKNLKSHDKGKTISVIKETLKKLEYNIHIEVLDGKHYVPQHRERIIIVGFDEQVFKGKENFSFPQIPESNKKIKDILEAKVNSKYTLSDKLWNYLQDYAAKHRAKGNGFGFGLTDLNGIARTMSARYYKDGAEILIPQKGKNPRRLTPFECSQLQGFPENFRIPVSDNQAYKQFGNSVVVPMIQAVGAKMIDALKFKNEPKKIKNHIYG